MTSQTVVQILCCFTLGRYTATVEEGGLEIRGPQPLAGPLPTSIKARRDELVAYLLECCGGTWPAAPGSVVYTAWDTKRRARREFLKKPREERAREFQRRLRESRQREGVT